MAKNQKISNPFCHFQDITHIHSMAKNKPISEVISLKPFEIFQFCRKILVTHPNFQVCQGERGVGVQPQKYIFFKVSKWFNSLSYHVVVKFEDVHNFPILIIVILIGINLCGLWVLSFAGINFLSGTKLAGAILRV